VPGSHALVFWCVLKVEGFLVFWNVMLAGQVVPHILEDHVAFIFCGKPMQEAGTFKVSVTACPTAQCPLLEGVNSQDRMLLLL